MKTLNLLVLAAALGAGAISAAPALAANSTAVLSCNTGGSEQQTNNAKQQLSDELRLSTKLSSTIDDWNGCLKVQYTNASGHTTVALYDPDTLKLVNTLS